MKRIIALLCCLITCFSLLGCSNTALSGDEVIKTTNEFRIHSSDSGFDDFMNEYFQRHNRSGDLSVGRVQLGDGATYQKVWETDSLIWFDSTNSGFRDYNGTKNIETFLYNIDIDKFGYVHSVDSRPLDGMMSSVLQGQGWSFPTYRDLGTYGVEFNEGLGGWVASDGHELIFDQGFMVDNFYGNVDEEYFINCPTFEGIDAFLAPYMEIDMRITDNGDGTSMDTSNVEDWYFCWQIEGSDEWYQVSQLDYATKPETQGLYNIYRTYFHMYLHENWAGQRITRLGIKIIPKEGKRLSVDLKIGYVRMMADTRMAINQDCYISTLEKYVAYTNDFDALKECLPKARQAMLFYLNALDGKNGLVDLTYMQGHESTEGAGHGNVTGFWDTIRGCTLNLESNYGFYTSLIALANLERIATSAGIDVGQVKIVDPYLPSGDIVYQETAESLENLAKTVKANIQKPYTQGGFWNPKTGRFAYGLYDEGSKMGSKGEPLDYGYTDYNLQAIYHGVATEEQAKSILSWISGERTVLGDTSQNEDIYFYDFAPRFSTKDNVWDFINTWAGKSSIGWSYHCPDGGAAMHVSFYDVISRTFILGANNSFARLKEVQTWYEAVKECGGLAGRSFYAAYYAEKQLEGDIKNFKIYQMQGGGPNGAVGLTDEFTEASTFYATVPYSYFGLDAYKYKTLNVSPNIPDGLKYLSAENLRYSEINYDMYVTNNEVIISGLSSTPNGEKVEITFNKPKNGYKVRVNGKETSDYKEVGGKVIVTVPFGKVKVTIG